MIPIQFPLSLFPLTWFNKFQSIPKALKGKSWEEKKVEEDETILKLGGG